MLLIKALLTIGCHDDEAWLLTLGMYWDDIIIQGNNASGVGVRSLLTMILSMGVSLTSHDCAWRRQD